jgi:hypothetical protein
MFWIWKEEKKPLVNTIGDQMSHYISEGYSVYFIYKTFVWKISCDLLYFQTIWEINSNFENREHCAPFIIETWAWQNSFIKSDLAIINRRLKRLCTVLYRRINMFIWSCNRSIISVCCHLINPIFNISLAYRQAIVLKR